MTALTPHPSTAARRREALARAALRSDRPPSAEDWALLQQTAPSRATDTAPRVLGADDGAFDFGPEGA